MAGLMALLTMLAAVPGRLEGQATEVRRILFMDVCMQSTAA